MSKRPSMVYQVNEALKKQIRFGESKYQAKQVARAEGKSGPEGIFSVDTMESYRKQSIEFATWTKQTHGCRTLEEARRHAGDYLSRNIERGDSAWTLQLQRSALRKLYQEPTLASEVKMPIRHKAEVTRSRGKKASDHHFSEKKNQKLVDFQRGVGLRRHELAALKPTNVYEREGRAFVFVEQGKGGRSREVPVLKSYRDHVLTVAKSTQDIERPIFETIPVHMDVHGYRREYAQNLYAEVAGEAYMKGSPVYTALECVTNALGHDRLDVVIRSYI